MAEPELTEAEYLREIEQLARAVADAAGGEDWFTYGEEPPGATRLHRAVNRLARSVRRHHFDGDGCLPDERERPELRLAGVLLLYPDAMPAGVPETYEQLCRRLGVPAREEGWALWNTWAEDGRPVTMVVTAVEATEGVLRNWARGIPLYPVLPLPGQLELVRQGWFEPMTLSPNSTRRLGVAGQR
ncbi:hypothetical protein F0L68_25825 [Solihabitans fulvus]|uniref:Uncharacterized protein n=1 Tax=Solihabitans fulvus TaxID=1892852 RepID=A0A5B2X169_9PSEU|nr:hypothetical protein [Solihabitans fulvus]KAA2256919.1 hypothetical protein F0L68_25825 [Solihabitans fulvus]